MEYTMNYFIKRAFIISLLMLSSAFAAGEPASWDYHQSNKNIIDIRDSESNHLALLTTEDLPKEYSWTCNKFMIATINDPAGKIIGQMQMISDPKDYLLIGYNRKVWLIPQTAFQPNILPTRMPNPRVPNTHPQSQTAKTSMTRHTYPSEQTHRARTTQSSQFPSLAEALRQAHDPSMAGRQQDHSESSAVIDLTQDSETFSSQNNHMHAEVSRPAPIATQTKTPRTVRITGKKRVREDEKEETHASKRTKHDNLEWDKVAYWRINPDQTAELQLCDIEGNVLHTEAVRTKYGKRKIIQGYLNITLNKEQIILRRDPKDKANLEDNDFAAGSNAHHHCYYGETRHIRTNIKVANIEMAAYWRINPDQQDELQLCDKDGNVLHTEKVRTSYGERKLHQFNKHKGTLWLRINKKVYFFKRDSKDLTNLEKSGFAEGSNQYFKAYGKVYKNHSLAAAYWRIDPDQPGYFQLCDQNGTVLHTGKVITSKGDRKLSNGYLNITLNKEQIILRRDPKDTAILGENGFAPGQIATIWKQSTAKGVAEDLMDCEQETGVDNAVTVSPSTHYNSETDDDEELSDDLLEFCDLLEEELSNDLLKFRNLLEETLASNS